LFDKGRVDKHVGNFGNLNCFDAVAVAGGQSVGEDFRVTF